MSVLRNGSTVRVYILKSDHLVVVLAHFIAI